MTRPVVAYVDEGAGADLRAVALMASRRPSEFKAREDVVRGANGTAPTDGDTHVVVEGRGLTVAVRRFAHAPWGAAGTRLPRPRAFAAALATALDVLADVRVPAAHIRREAGYEVAKDAAAILDARDPVWRGEADDMAVEEECAPGDWGMSLSIQTVDLLPGVSLATVNRSEPVAFGPADLRALASRWTVVLMADPIAGGAGWLLEPLIHDGSQLYDLRDRPDGPMEAVRRQRDIHHLLAERTPTT